MLLACCRNSSSLGDTKQSRHSSGRISNLDYLFSTKGDTPKTKETYRPLRRRSESSGSSGSSGSNHYRIGAFRHEPADKPLPSRDRDTKPPTSRLSYTNLSRTPSLTATPSYGSFTRTSSGLSKYVLPRLLLNNQSYKMQSGRVQPTPCVVVCRAISRTSSVSSSRDAPCTHRPSQEETVPRLSSLNRSLSGKLSGSQLSSNSRTTLRSAASSSTSSEDDPQSCRIGGGGLCGIRNVGNSCYQNSVFQFLKAIPEMAHFLLGSKVLKILNFAVKCEGTFFLELDDFRKNRI